MRAEPPDGDALDKPRRARAVARRPVIPAQEQEAVFTRLATAAQASTTPCTMRGPALPASDIGRAVVTRSVRTSAAVRRGFRSSSSATIPETWAAASELPEKKS